MEQPNLTGASRGQRRENRSHWSALIAVAALGALCPAVASAAPCLAVALTARPADRPALRQAIAGEQARSLEAWRAKGLVASYRLLWARFPDTGVWDAMELLTFPDEAAMTRWRKSLPAAGSAFAPAALALAQSVQTTPCDTVRGGGPATARDPAVLAIPYQVLIPPKEYLAYLDGYTIPQFRGWIEAGALDSYEVVTSRYPAARGWNATILLRYRDDQALGRREELVAATRARLAADPAWKAFSDSKKATRTEGVVAVADEIAAAGPGR